MAYLDRILKAQALGVIDKNTVANVNVQHDDFCPMLNGGKHCCCDPDITIHTNGGVFSINEDGTLTKESVQ